jgi:hypothetical protein
MKIILTARLTAINEYGDNTFPASISTYCLQSTAITLFLGDILKKEKETTIL